MTVPCYCDAKEDKKERKRAKFQDGNAKQGMFLCFSNPIYSFHSLTTYLSIHHSFSHHCIFFSFLIGFTEYIVSMHSKPNIIMVYGLF